MIQRSLEAQAPDMSKYVYQATHTSYSVPFRTFDEWLKRYGWFKTAGAKAKDVFEFASAEVRLCMAYDRNEEGPGVWVLEELVGK